MNHFVYLKKKLMSRSHDIKIFLRFYVVCTNIAYIQKNKPVCYGSLIATNLS